MIVPFTKTGKLTKVRNLLQRARSIRNAGLPQKVPWQFQLTIVLDLPKMTGLCIDYNVSVF